jgi:glycosyltransferase involved in cell wall biosynthesis
MKIFVVSWFFPPNTSSEGIVTYKLLRNSRHSYDVCSAQSNLWTYKQEMPLNADNITVFPIDTDDFQVWIDAALAIFGKRHAASPYDAVMTRSMPPESILFAQRLRATHPDIPWVASLADPIAKDPYQIKGWVLESEQLTEREKAEFLADLHNGCDSWRSSQAEGIQRMCELKDIEDYAIQNANTLVFPNESLKSYVMGTHRRGNILIVPHSFDRQLYPLATEPTRASGGGGGHEGGASNHEGGGHGGGSSSGSHEGGGSSARDGSGGPDARITLTFIGHSDSVRSLDPIVCALAHLRDTNAKILDNLHLRFIGHVPENTNILIYNYFLHNIISVEGSVTYRASLACMQESDWLIHVDAQFDFLANSGGSIFFAGKLADYMGTNRPILALTDRCSPASTIVRAAGGLCLSQDDICGIAEALTAIAEDRVDVSINRAYRDSYDATLIARDFDAKLAGVLAPLQRENFDRAFWPQHANTSKQSSADASPPVPLPASTAIVPKPASHKKLLTICVPAYNVEQYLDRCLFSLVASSVAEQLEIIVINDGSNDGTRWIAEAYQQHYPAIIHLINKANGGHGSTINAALDIATGEYFRVLDGDDWLDSANLAKLLTNLCERDLHPDLISTNYQQVYSDDGHTVAWTKVGDAEYYHIYMFADEDFSMEYFTMASTMFRTELLKAANFQLQEHTYYVDVEFIIFPLPYVQTVMFTPESVYRYALGYSGQSINQSVFAQRYGDHDRVIRRVLSYYAEKRSQLKNGQILYIDSLLLRHLLRSHYQLSLIWDSDNRRGAAHAKDFDTYLQEINPELHRQCGKRYKAVMQAQATEFSPRSVARLKTMENGTHYRSIKDIAWDTMEKYRHTPFGRKLAQSTRARELVRKIRAN